MNAGALPRPSATLRLLPARPLRRARPPLAIQVALVLALLLHGLAGVALVARPAWFQARPVAAAAPREAQVELVQNDRPASGDAPIGGTGKNPVNEAAGQPSPPPPPAAPAHPPAPPSPDLPVATRGETSPPQPTPSPASSAPAPPGPQPQQDQTPDIRLSDSDETQGMAGGSAETPAEADPKARNRLPAYPTEAGQLRQEGAVLGVIRVKPDGTAAAVAVVRSSGYPSLDSAAVAAWRKWRFKPALDHGAPIDSEVPVQLNFVLRP